MKLMIIEHKPCWRNPQSPTGYATDGGFPFQVGALSALFDETVLVLPCSSSPQPVGAMPLTGHKMRVRPLTPPFGIGLGRKLLFPLWSAWCLRRILAEAIRCDAIHTPIPGDVGTLGMLVALLLRKPLFVRHCGNWLRPVTIADRLWRWSMETFAGGRRVMLATGGAAEPPSRRNPNVRWIFSSSLSEAEIVELAKHQVKLDVTNLRLIIVGRQESGKGTEILIEALALVHRQYPHAVLEVVGEGAILPLLRRRAEELGLGDKVIFHGQVNHAGVLKLLEKAHLFCFPTHSEGFPKAVLEALACGLPVLTTPVSVLPTLLANGCGTLIEPRAESIAKAVFDAVSSADRYQLMSAKARETARQYSLERWRDTIGGYLHQAWGSPKAAEDRQTTQIAASQSR